MAEGPGSTPPTSEGAAASPLAKKKKKRSQVVRRSQVTWPCAEAVRTEEAPGGLGGLLFKVEEAERTVRVRVAESAEYSEVMAHLRDEFDVQDGILLFEEKACEEGWPSLLSRLQAEDSTYEQARLSEALEAVQKKEHEAMTHLASLLEARREHRLPRDLLLRMLPSLLPSRLPAATHAAWSLATSRENAEVMLQFGAVEKLATILQTASLIVASNCLGALQCLTAAALNDDDAAYYVEGIALTVLPAAARLAGSMEGRQAAAIITLIGAAAAPCLARASLKHLPSALTLLENPDLAHAGATVFACLLRDDISSRETCFFEPVPTRRKRKKESVAERAHSLCLDLAIKKQHDDDDDVDLSSLLHTLMYALWGLTGLLMTKSSDWSQTWELCLSIAESPHDQTLPVALMLLDRLATAPILLLTAVLPRLVALLAEDDELDAGRCVREASDSLIIEDSAGAGLEEELDAGRCGREARDPCLSDDDDDDVDSVVRAAQREEVKRCASLVLARLFGTTKAKHWAGVCDEILSGPGCRALWLGTRSADPKVRRHAALCLFHACNSARGKKPPSSSVLGLVVALAGAADYEGASLGCAAVWAVARRGDKQRQLLGGLGAARALLISLSKQQQQQQEWAATALAELVIDPNVAQSLLSDSSALTLLCDNAQFSTGCVLTLHRLLNCEEGLAMIHETHRVYTLMLTLLKLLLIAPSSPLVLRAAISLLFEVLRYPRSRAILPKALAEVTNTKEQQQQQPLASLLVGLLPPKGPMMAEGVGELRFEVLRLIATLAMDPKNCDPLLASGALDALSATLEEATMGPLLTVVRNLSLGAHLHLELAKRFISTILSVLDNADTTEESRADASGALANLLRSKEPRVRTLLYKTQLAGASSKARTLLPGQRRCKKQEDHAAWWVGECAVSSKELRAELKIVPELSTFKLRSQADLVVDVRRPPIALLQRERYLSPAAMWGGEEGQEALRDAVFLARSSSEMIRFPEPRRKLSSSTGKLAASKSSPAFFDDHNRRRPQTTMGSRRRPRTASENAELVELALASVPTKTLWRYPQVPGSRVFGSDIALRPAEGEAAHYYYLRGDALPAPARRPPQDYSQPLIAPDYPFDDAASLPELPACSFPTGRASLLIRPMRLRGPGKLHQSPTVRFLIDEGNNPTGLPEHTLLLSTLTDEESSQC